MTDEAKSPLRRRMIEDMTIRKFAPKTEHDYVQRIKKFAVFLGRSPDTATFEDVRRYQLHLAASGVGVPTINQTVSTLRFFFKVMLRRHDIVEHTHFIHEPRKLPVVLSVEEVTRLLDAAPGLKYKAALSVAYGAGLRAAEVVSLKVSDIDSRRMIIRVEQGNRICRRSKPSRSAVPVCIPASPTASAVAATSDSLAKRQSPRSIGFPMWPRTGGRCSQLAASCIRRSTGLRQLSSLPTPPRGRQPAVPFRRSRADRGVGSKQAHDYMLADWRWGLECEQARSAGHPKRCRQIRHHHRCRLPGLGQPAP
jgi:integrase